MRLVGILTVVFALDVTSADGSITLRPGMMGVADIGATECQVFNEMHPFGPTGLERQALTWLQGYVYGKTAKTLDEVLGALSPGHGWEFDTLARYFVDYCEASPELTLSDAGENWWRAIQANENPTQPEG